MARQFRASARRITDELGIGGQLRLVGDAFSQKLDAAGDDRQHIVEVVGDASGELADSLDLLRLPELLFRCQLGRQIPHEHVEYVAAATPDGGHGDFDHHIQAVLAACRDHEALAGRMLVGLLQALDHLRVAQLVDFRQRQIGHRLPDRLLPRPPEDGFGLRIPFDDHAGLVQLDEGIERIGDNPHRHLFALEQLLLCPLALRDVARDLGCANDLAGRELDRGNAERDIDEPPILALALGLVVVDPVALAYPFQDEAFLGAQGVGNDDVDAAADGLLRGKSE